MIEKDLNKLLNYMKQYVENKDEHDSEPMLNWKDLKLVLDEIERLNNIIKGLEQELIKKLEAVKTIKDTLGEGAYVLNPHIDLLEQEYNYFYKKLQELKGSDKEWKRF